MEDINHLPLEAGEVYYFDGEKFHPYQLPAPVTDPLAATAANYPAYWVPLPAHWQFIDTYRVGTLFPLNDSRLEHARKKLLVPGTRTGGKTRAKDIREARDTLSQWLIDHLGDQP